MKSGIILAGGEGTRLGRNRPYNKHLALVYDRPMIEYPIENMKAMGVEHTTIVSSPEGVADMLKAYRDNINGMNVSYETQYHPNGSAHALGHTALEGTFPVLCGDVYFDPPLPRTLGPTLFWTNYENANQHSVYDPTENRIVEKPTIDLGKRAVVGYYYDERVYEVIKNLRPSERGELELVDLHNWYLQNGANIREYKGFFQDMGTPAGLLRVANHLHDKLSTI